MTVVHPIRTHIMDIHTRSPLFEQAIDKALIFFGHANGYLSLFQGTWLHVMRCVPSLTSTIDQY
jgi:hypothetical protein